MASHRLNHYDLINKHTTAMVLMKYSLISVTKENEEESDLVLRPKHSDYTFSHIYISMSWPMMLYFMHLK